MPEILRMPEVAANTLEAILTSWNVELNTPYAAGDAIVTVETEKAVVDVEAEADGVLLRRLVEEGAEVEVGAPIAVWGKDGESEGDVDALLSSLGVAGPSDDADESRADEVPAAGADEPEAQASVASQSQVADELPTATVPAGQPTAAKAGPSAPAEAAEHRSPSSFGADAAPTSAPASDTESSTRIFASPLARKIARDSGLDLNQVVGTGPGGRIRRRDVDTALTTVASDQGSPAIQPDIASPAVATTTPEYEDIPASRFRQAVARRLTESKRTAPHFYLHGSARVDKLLALRQDLNAGGTVKVSLNDLVVKAVARAHVLVPALNVQWNGDSIRQFSDVDIAVAVATESGLLTPVVRGVDRLSLAQLVERTQDLVARAKDRRLQQRELEGGSISVTNLGMYGTEEFAAIINPPQAAILAVGAAREEAVVENGGLAVGTVMRVTLAVDHRPVDGVTAAEWMRVLVGLLQHPAQILL